MFSNFQKWNATYDRVYYNFENLGTIIPKRETKYILHILFLFIINFENNYIFISFYIDNPNIS